MIQAVSTLTVFLHNSLARPRPKSSIKVRGGRARARNAARDARGRFLGRAISLLVGWYLLQPPSVRLNTFDDKAPLREWNQVSAFDSASQCQTWRDGIMLSIANGSLNKKDWDIRLWNASRCIEADDPRLAR